jgi:hypothetical protein
MNLSTQQKQTYTCEPKEAVICAYAQSLNDWNTWNYSSRYNHLVKEGKYTWLCGDFSVFKDGRQF